MASATVTLLFTDVEGSTRLLDRLGGRYVGLLAEHHRLMRDAIAASGGREVDTAGDSFFVVFSRTVDAVGCAQRAQRMLACGEWPDGEAPRVRMGIHTGSPIMSDGAPVGMDVHRAARVMAVAHGGQVLLTEDAVGALDAAVEVLDLGYHRLKDLREPEHLFQLLRPGLDREFPRLRSLNRSNLPAPANPLVGRQPEVAQALGLLAGCETRLLTLHGPGGAGKTRLALEVAAEAVSGYRDGVWIVFLAAIVDPTLVSTEVARVLDVDPVGGERLEQTLAAVLAEREFLLVLDNFEHLVGAAGWVADLLAAAPGVDVLVTSREALRIRGEHLMEVPPLPLEDAGELFLQRARAVRPELGLDGEDRAAVERICARLDGLPLALELAAARIAVFGLSVLEARLAARLALPEGPRDLPERQRTLRATIDWSYQLLDPVERSMLRSLAPFVGGVRLDSAERIWGVAALDRLVSLIEKSLLHRREDPDGEPRCWMLETVREFALERASLEDNANTVAGRHAEHFLALSEEAKQELHGPRQRHWLDRLESDYANLRAALDYLIEQSPSRALRMAASLLSFWDTRGYLPEARRRLTEALASAPADSPDRGEALFGAGRVALQLGEAVEAEPSLLESLSLARRRDDNRLAALALSHLGWVAEVMADEANITLRHEQAIAAARADGDPRLLGTVLNNYGVMALMRGDLKQAHRLIEEALPLLRGAGDRRMIAMAANNLAVAASNENHLEYAQMLIDEAIGQARELEDRPMIVRAFATRAEIALIRGELARAAADLGEAIKTSSAYELVGATSLLSSAATIAAHQCDPRRAAMLWAAADRARAHSDLDENPAVARLRAHWEPRARAASPHGSSWEAARAAGAELRLDEALALARDVADTAQSVDPHTASS